MNYMVLHGGILSGLMLGSALVLIQAQSEKGVFSYIGLYLDRTMVQSSTLVCLESDVEAIE